MKVCDTRTTSLKFLGSFLAWKHVRSHSNSLSSPLLQVDEQLIVETSHTQSRSATKPAPGSAKRQAGPVASESRVSLKNMSIHHLLVDGPRSLGLWLRARPRRSTIWGHERVAQSPKACRPLWGPGMGQVEKDRGRSVGHLSPRVGGGHHVGRLQLHRLPTNPPGRRRSETEASGAPGFPE